MQATQPTRVIQYGTDDAQNPWCVVEETTHRDYFNDTSVRRVCTVNSILTRRSLDPTTFTSASSSSANIQVSLDSTMVTSTTPASASVQETHENRMSSTDDDKNASFKKSQKKVAKSRSRRKKFFRVLLCCSSGAADADDDMYDMKPMDSPHSIKKSATIDNARDQNRASENVRNSSKRAEYVPVESQWSVTPEYVEGHRQTASSREYDATITQEVRRQSAISIAPDSTVIEVLREQRHYECTLARVPEYVERHRGVFGRSSVTIRELSPTNSHVSQTANEKKMPETTSTTRENLSLQTNPKSSEQSETQNKRRRRSGKRVSFGSTPTLSEATPGPLQDISEGSLTSAIVSSFSSENPLHQHSGNEDNSVKHKCVNTENMASNANSRKDMTVKSALKVCGATALNAHNDLIINSNNDAHKTSACTDRRGENLVIKRRSDGTRYVTKKNFTAGDQGYVDVAQAPAQSEQPRETHKLTEYILDTPRLSRKTSSDEKKNNTSTIKRPRVSFGSMPTLSGISLLEVNITDTPLESSIQGDYPVTSNGKSSFSSDNMLDQHQRELNTTVKTSEVNIARNTNVPLKSILKVRGASALNLNDDVTRSLNSLVKKPTNGQELEVKEWVVKRRSDGSRYVTKINNNTTRRRSTEVSPRVSDTVPVRVSVCKTTRQQREFSASDPSISRKKQHGLALHRDVDLSNATLLAVL